MIFASMAFKDYANDKLVSFINTSYQQMSTNPKYAYLKPYVDGMKDRNDAFIVGIALASRRDGKRREERDALRADLLEFVVKKITRALEDSDQNSASFITDAGFEVRGAKPKGKKAEKAPVTELATPTNFIGVNLPKSGSAAISWNESLNAINYALLSLTLNLVTI